MISRATVTSNESNIIVRMGVDLSKNVFQVHGVNNHEKVILRRKLTRDQFPKFTANLSPCIIGMEACGGSHYWSRILESQGHTVKLMAGQHVKPYVKNNKNDMRDAEAICEAVSRPTMRYVTAKTIEQQDIQSLHRIRQEAIKMRTMQINQIRGLLLEYGIAIPIGSTKVRKEIPLILEDADNNLSMLFRVQLSGLYDMLCVLDQQIECVTDELEKIVQTNDYCKRLKTIDGVGTLSATALYASVGTGNQFKCGRDMAAWLGLVPRQQSSGGKTVLLGISKKGDRYLRSLFVHGGRAIVALRDKKENKRNLWLRELVNKKGANKASVALANKNIRIAWAILQSGEEYRCAA